jgi:chromosome segregation ATPase
VYAYSAHSLLIPILTFLCHNRFYFYFFVTPPQMADFKAKVAHDQANELSKTQAVLWLQNYSSQHHVQELKCKLDEMTRLHIDVTDQLNVKGNELITCKELIVELKKNIQVLEENMQAMQEDHLIKLEQQKSDYDIQMTSMKSEHGVIIATLQDENDVKLKEQAKACEDAKQELYIKFESQLKEKEQVVLSYQQNYSISNEQHKHELDQVHQQCDMLKLQLKESEENYDDLEATLRKMTREQKFLKEELDKV